MRISHQGRPVPLNTFFTLRRTQVQLDPSAFLADPELIKALEKHASSFTCGEDRVLFRQGDLPVGLFIIHKGEAALSINPGSNDQVFSCLATAGSVLGIPGLIGNQPYSLTADSSQRR